MKGLGIACLMIALNYIRSNFINKTIKSLLILAGLLMFALSCGPVAWQQKTEKTEEIGAIRVGFYLPHLNVRGTDVALYDYADFNEKILGNNSFILYLTDKTQTGDSPDSPDSVRAKFKERFENRFYEGRSFQEIESIILKEKIDVMYNIKSGFQDGAASKIAKNAVHAVFELQPHGDAYAAISPWLSNTLPFLNVPVVPHLVRLDSTSDNLRKELSIPLEAIIFGRHGGWDTFDMIFAQEAVAEYAASHPDSYFLFLNTKPFSDLKNVIFLSGSADMIYKTKFINTCDAMIHARTQGETFGLSIAEFSIKNNSVIAWSGSKERAHIDFLGKKAFYYAGKEDLKIIFERITRDIDEIRRENWDVYSKKYGPEAVMREFDAVFLRPLVKNKASSRN